MALFLLSSLILNLLRFLGTDFFHSLLIFAPPRRAEKKLIFTATIRATGFRNNLASTQKNLERGKIFGRLRPARVGETNYFSVRSDKISSMRKKL
jgi:hypothetical protein